MRRGAIAAAALTLGIAQPLFAGEAGSRNREIVVLGAGQGAGAPQIGHAWDRGFRRGEYASVPVRTGGLIAINPIFAEIGVG